MPQATGPSGVQPKNWLTPGVSTMAASAPADTAVVASTSGLRPPVSSVWPSWVSTSVDSAIVLARRARPVIRPACQAAVAPRAVAPPRSASTRARSWPGSGRTGPAAASRWPAGPDRLVPASATASAGSMSVMVLTSSNCRVLSGARPVSAVPSTVNATSPALPPTRIDTASRTRAHSARPSSSASMTGSVPVPVSTRSAAPRAEREPRELTPMPTSAILIAAASLVPSPAMATTWPARCSAWTIRTFCSGDTRANTVLSAIRCTCRPSGSRLSSAPVSTRPACGMPTWRAIATAVAGWSPVTMVTRTPASHSSRTVRLAAGRGVSVIAMNPASVRSVTRSLPAFPAAAAARWRAAWPRAFPFIPLLPFRW